MSKYRRLKSLVGALEQEGVDTLAPKQRKAYTAYKEATASIERAVRLILDEEVRRIIEMRYIKGQKYVVTVAYFGNMHPATVARKINEGIESVANSLKYID
ncbi:hypothetical protein [Cohnella sp. AR92]|uniref:hypothetical protein n=1 Tax=Cohnella sp. AR92 TaxID=648716 RepID=UPI000F8D1A19|nr:hypothetical protein [Cohnella sp. AR92]RUS47554.1 hypothetical protein ELR57_07090 [Cohnella sp. AR92]